MLTFPVTDLAADYNYRRVAGILDDKTTEALDVKPISESTMPAYFEAISSLRKAAVLALTFHLSKGALGNVYPPRLLVGDHGIPEGPTTRECTSLP